MRQIGIDWQYVTTVPECLHYINQKVQAFYRAMHFSANARSWDRMSSVRPSVRLSVTLVDCDHIGWKSAVVENKSDNISETRKDRGKVTMDGL